MTQIELNRQLLDAARVEPFDLTRIEALLKLGANPLGYINEDEDCPLVELFCDGQERKCAKRLPALTELFIRYGMDVDSADLHCLEWVRDEFGIKTLRILLNAGLSTDSAECFAVELVGDILMFEVGWFSKTTPRFDYTWAESMDYAMRMIMLIASYENIFKTSRYIRELVGAGEGDAHLLARFRKWDNYCCSVDVVDRDNCNVTVFDVGSNEAVWRFKMIGYADMDRR